MITVSLFFLYLINTSKKGSTVLYDMLPVRNSRFGKNDPDAVLDLPPGLHVWTLRTLALPGRVSAVPRYWGSRNLLAREL